MECYPYHYLHGEEQRLGMFVHWGLYAIGAWHEQEQMLLGVSREEYEARVEQFHPRNYDPEKWVLLAKEAGLRSIIPARTGIMKMRMTKNIYIVFRRGIRTSRIRKSTRSS